MESNFSDNCVHHYNVGILNLFDPELQVINSKPVIKNKLDELLSELTNFTSQTISVLHYKKRNDHKVFNSSATLTASDSESDKTFVKAFIHALKHYDKNQNIQKLFRSYARL